MDFELLKEHPWAAVGIIGGGGLILFLAMRKSSGGGASAGPVYYGGAGTDPTAAALAAQQGSQSAAVQGLSIQGQTQIALASIGANVSGANIAASQDVTNRQTDAELRLGLGTLDAQIATAGIGAAVQMKYIDAILAAFRGPSPTGSPVTNPSQPVSTPVYNAPGNPISSYTPPSPVSLAPPVYSGVAGGVMPEGSQLVPLPLYGNCDPRDSACVASNQSINIDYENRKLSTNAANNKAQCLANASLSVGQPNYAALVAACG